jgi:hypothetical protein
VIGFLTRWLGPALSSPPQASDERFAILTPTECAVIFRTLKCCDCGEGRLCPATDPSGYMEPVACSHCGSEFNLFISQDFCHGERLSPPGPRDLGERAHLYGL